MQSAPKVLVSVCKLMNESHNEYVFCALTLLNGIRKVIHQYRFWLALQDCIALVVSSFQTGWFSTTFTSSQQLPDWLVMSHVH